MLIVHKWASDSEESGVYLTDLLKLFWKRKILISVFLFVGGCASFFYSKTIPDIFRSEVLLVPADEQSTNNMASLVGRFGGLASIAGVDFSNNGTSRVNIALEVLKSREFVSEIVQKYEWDVPLIAASGWNKDDLKLVIDQKLYDESQKKWVRNVKPPLTPVPSDHELHERYLQLISIHRDKTTGFVKIGMEFYSPHIVKEWLDIIVKEINAEIKARDVFEAKKSISYLESQLSETSITNIKPVFYELIEEQTKTIMFANVRKEYVFRTIDPSYVPQFRAKPKRLVICVMGSLLGAFLGFVFVLLNYHFRKALLEN